MDDATARELARFWPKVSQQGTCWVWTASKITGGYGAFSWHGRTSGAHRYAYETFVSPIPEDLEVDHLCHQRACVNPLHLALVTKAQNQQNRAGASIVSTSGYRGVYQHSKGPGWLAKVQVKGKSRQRGPFATPEEANIAAIALRNELMTHNRLDRLSA